MVSAWQKYYFNYNAFFKQIMFYNFDCVAIVTIVILLITSKSGIYMIVLPYMSAIIFWYQLLAFAWKIRVIIGASSLR